MRRRFSSSKSDFSRACRAAKGISERSGVESFPESLLKIVMSQARGNGA